MEKEEKYPVEINEQLVMAHQILLDASLMLLFIQFSSLDWKMKFIIVEQFLFHSTTIVSHSSSFVVARCSFSL